jgi:hypothetical protein
VLIAASASLVSACAYNVPVGSAPNLNVYSSYTEKVAGSYALFVDTNSFMKTVKSTGYACSAHTYPLDLRNSFREATVKTVQQLVENVEVVDHPLTSEELKQHNLMGQIIVRSDDLNARVQFVPGFWSASADANVELSASLTVDGHDGRLLGTTGEGAGNAQGEAGMYCGGGATTIGQATEKAVKQLLGQLGERLSNSPRLRGKAG